MNMIQKLVVAALLIVVIVFNFFSFSVSEVQTVVVLRLGKIHSTDFAPGRHPKIPFMDTVYAFDSRIRNVDNRPESFLTAEKKNVNVDFFIKWRISEVGTYYTSTSGGNERRATQLLNEIVKKGLKDEFSLRTIKEAVSGDRAELMKLMTELANGAAAGLGVEIVDVRVKRIDFSKDVSESVYRRMRAERERVAKDFRARGQEEKEKIQADADRQSTVLLAEAERDSSILRGEGDARAAKVYSDAYGQDFEFYSFYRSLSAYRTAISTNNDVLVITPDSDFFKYFKSATP
jgi:membrane protease subunit HflC